MTTHFLLRVGDSKNFIRSTKSHIWGVKSTASYGKWFLSNVKEGDLLWFVKNKTKGQLIAVATFVSHNRREYGPLVNLTPSNDELGWTGDKADQCDFELHYKDLYDLTPFNLISNIQGQQTIRIFGTGCSIDLPNEYIYIARYTNTVPHLQELLELNNAKRLRKTRVKSLSAHLPSLQDMLSPKTNTSKTYKDDIDITLHTPSESHTPKHLDKPKKTISDKVQRIIQEAKREKAITQAAALAKESALQKQIKPPPLYKMFSVHNDNDNDKTKTKTKTYFRSLDTNLIYDYYVYYQTHQLVVLGKWVSKGKYIWLK